MNIAVTWPKTKPLEDYLREVHRAARDGERLFFKVSSAPTKVETGDRCYQVYAGHVRGWLPIRDVIDLGADAPIDNVTGQRFAEGTYIIRDPIWTPTPSYPAMQGFRGFRYWSEP